MRARSVGAPPPRAGLCPPVSPHSLPRTIAELCVPLSLSGRVATSHGWPRTTAACSCVAVGSGHWRWARWQRAVLRNGPNGGQCRSLRPTWRRTPDKTHTTHNRGVALYVWSAGQPAASGGEALDEGGASLRRQTRPASVTWSLGNGVFWHPSELALKARASESNPRDEGILTTCFYFSLRCEIFDFLWM